MANDGSAATHLSVHLARFAEMGVLPDDGREAPAGDPVTWLFGVDEGRHGGEFGCQRGTEFAAIGLHPDESSALACAAAPVGAFAGAGETWSGAFVPARSIGICNWMAPLGHASQPMPADEPLMVITSAGWVLDAGFDVERALRFGAAVTRVRASMSSVPGMHSSHAFVFPGLLELDSITMTFWRDLDGMRTFAYQAGTHKTEMDAFRLDETADRTSFTRLRPITTHGTWWGGDPLARAPR